MRNGQSVAKRTEQNVCGKIPVALHTEEVEPELPLEANTAGAEREGGGLHSAAGPAVAVCSYTISFYSTEYYWAPVLVWASSAVFKVELAQSESGAAVSSTRPSHRSF